MYFDDVTFRVALAKLRIRTLKQAAELIGISESYMGIISRGNVPPPETRARIATSLGCEVEHLWRPIAQPQA